MRLTSIDVSYQNLKILWEAEKGCANESERLWFYNTLLGALSQMVPAEPWKSALETASCTVRGKRNNAETKL